MSAAAASPSGSSSPTRERPESPHETEPVIKEGWLLKRSNKSRRKWKRRWVVLRGQRLNIFKNNEEAKLKKFVNLRDGFAMSLYGRKHTPMFAVAVPDKVIYMQAETVEDMHDWIDAINTTTGATPDPGKVQLDEDLVAPASPHGDHTDDNADSGVESDPDASATRLRSMSDPPEATTQESVIVSGYLDVRTHLRKKWKKRWFVLRSTGRLMGYTSPEEFELLKLLRRREMLEVLPHESSKRDHCFKLVMEGRSYVFSAKDADDAKRWMEALNEQIARAKADRA